MIRERVRGGAARVVDGALEVTVAGSFGSPGIRLRRRMDGWGDPPRMVGRRVLITGATSGIGQAAAQEMVRLGAQVTTIGRDRERTQRTARALASAGNVPGDPAWFLADLTLLADVERLAQELVDDGRTWDVLIHNAGALVADYQRTAEGFEATYASQVLAQHVLTSRLLPVLSRGTRPRVIVVSSGGMYAEGLAAEGVHMAAEDYDGVRAYARAKRAQVTMNQQWAHRSAGPVEFHCMHPGWADTPGVRTSLPGFRRATQAILRTPPEGADTVVWLAAQQDLPAPSGSFWLDRRPRGTVRLPGTRVDPAVSAALWDVVCRDSGVRPDLGASSAEG